MSKSSATNPTRFTVGAVLFVEGDERPLDRGLDRPREAGPAGALRGVARRASRRSTCLDQYLEVPAAEPLPAGSYYWHQLHGLAVTTTGGEPLGTVVDVFRAGEAEVYVVRGRSLRRDHGPRCGERGRRARSRRRADWSSTLSPWTCPPQPRPTPSPTGDHPTLTQGRPRCQRRRHGPMSAKRMRPGRGASRRRQ